MRDHHDRFETFRTGTISSADWSFLPNPNRDLTI